MMIPKWVFWLMFISLWLNVFVWTAIIVTLA